jgi:hypothetical protein
LLTSGLARGALWTLVALAAFFAADSLLFRTGWYALHLEPDSSAGSLEYQLQWLHRAGASKSPEVLVIGDSRIAEGFSARVANATLDRRLHFWNFGIPGTTPRVWYYALRAADPTRRRFAAIVIAIDKYSDADWFGLSEDRVTDQNFLPMELGLGDCLSFAFSMNATALRVHSLVSCLFRGVALRPDVQGFLAHPQSRLQRSADSLKNGLGYISDYGGKVESMRGLTVDWTSRTIHFPDGVSEPIRDNVTQFLLPEEVPNTGALARYRQRWLGGILDQYKDSPTRIVFLQLPRGPIVNPRVRGGHGFVDAASKLPRVTVLAADTFTDLERPELFADGLHLNREGRPIFSQHLAQRVDSIVTGGSH